jgi:hypothetical protein
MTSPSSMLGFLLCSMVKKTGVLTPEKRAHPPGGHAVFTSSPDPYHTKSKVLQRIKKLLQIYFKRIFFFEEVCKTWIVGGGFSCWEFPSIFKGSIAMTKSNYPERIIVGILSAVLIVLCAFYVRLTSFGSGGVHFVVPWGLIAIFISLYLFKENNRIKRAKYENRREYMNRHRQELLDNVLKKNKNSSSK